MRAQSGVVHREGLAEALELIKRHVVEGTCRPVWTFWWEQQVKLWVSFFGHSQCCKTVHFVQAEIVALRHAKSARCLKLCATSWTWSGAALGFQERSVSASLACALALEAGNL